METAYGNDLSNAVKCKCLCICSQFGSIRLLLKYLVVTINPKERILMLNNMNILFQSIPEYCKWKETAMLRL